MTVIARRWRLEGHPWNEADISHPDGVEQIDGPPLGPGESVEVVPVEDLRGAVETLAKIEALARDGDHGSLMDLGSRMVQIRELTRDHRLRGGRS